MIGGRSGRIVGWGQIVFAICATCVLLGQTEAGKPSFDIADVHLSPRTDWVSDLNHRMEGGYLINDRYEIHHATMLNLIQLAYNVDADKISGGPSWIDYDRFEVIARARPGIQPDTLLVMLQRLLADRFGLVVKPDVRKVPGYVLSKAKGELKLTSADSGESGCDMQARPALGLNDYKCRNITMDDFAVSIRRFVSPPTGGGLPPPVLNSTGIEGRFDLEMAYTGSGGSNDFVQALKKIGFELASGEVPAPVLAVDRVNEQPSPNRPGTTQSLPPLPPPQFEVASVKPCDGSCDHTATARFEPGGRVSAIGMPLMGLIRDAWNLPLNLEPVGMPDWFRGRDGNVSIEAKAPAGYRAGQSNRADMDAMLRALLIERFHMKVHYEDRPTDTYTLTAVKPKLTKADPASRTSCTRQFLASSGLQHMVCQNATMAQFAEQIPGLDPGIFYPVIDGTGIEGSWDFSFDYDYMASLRMPVPVLSRGAAPAEGQAPDPSGGYGFVDALEKRIGLKLKVSKHPQPVFVIDHIDRRPVEN